MKTPWMEMTVRDFQSALASSSPTPGGGTAAAIALGQASALTIMVCDLTLGKDKWQEGWGGATSALSTSVRTMSRAGLLADEDSDASDVGVAGLLASAACKGALFNVDINLDSLPEDMAVDIRTEAPKIQDEARVLSRKIMDAVRDRM